MPTMQSAALVGIVARRSCIFTIHLAGWLLRCKGGGGRGRAVIAQLPAPVRQCGFLSKRSRLRRRFWPVALARHRSCLLPGRSRCERRRSRHAEYALRIEHLAAPSRPVRRPFRIHPSEVRRRRSPRGIDPGKVQLPCRRCRAWKWLRQLRSFRRQVVAGKRPRHADRCVGTACAVPPCR
jgi:hypothetical protein